MAFCRVRWSTPWSPRLRVPLMCCPAASPWRLSAWERSRPCSPWAASAACLRPAGRQLHPGAGAGHAQPRRVAGDERPWPAPHLAFRMTPAPGALCRHCLLPVGRRGFTRAVNGEGCQFCCYGCCIAHQVKSGSGDASEAAWFLVRLGVGSFLSMNIMLFSLLVYSGAFSGADRRVLPTIQLLLWGLATPAVLILGEPFLRETWLQARHGRLTSSALIVLGSLAAYAYSTLAVFQRGGHLYFDTASMVLMLFTLGRYLEAA